jgi:hypothetical protein
MKHRRSSIACTTAAVPPTAGQLVTSERGVCGDPWLSIMLTLCHILHSVSHWPVLGYFINHAQELCLHCSKGDIWPVGAAHELAVAEHTGPLMMSCQFFICSPSTAVKSVFSVDGTGPHARPGQSLVCARFLLYQGLVNACAQ